MDCGPDAVKPFSARDAVQRRDVAHGLGDGREVLLEDRTVVAGDSGPSASANRGSSS
jgi:hypothetical protein